MTDALVTAKEAAELLKVKQATIYSYVSRGKLESIRKRGDSTSWFRRSDVDDLSTSRRSLVTKQPAGIGTIESAITEIDGASYFYRGQDPARLADTCSFEQVAELLWSGTIPHDPLWEPRSGAPATLERLTTDPGSLPLDRLRLAVVALAATDHLRFGQPRAAMAATARQLIAGMVESLPLIGDPPTGTSFVAKLWPRLSAKPATESSLRALEGSLIVIADHGVSPSTLAARVAAAYRADLYAIVETGLAVVAGAWHGGRTLSAEGMLDRIRRVGDAEVVMGELLRSETTPPGLGHTRYRGPDPRVRVITNLIEAAAPGHEALRALTEVQRITNERALPEPSVELALAALTHVFEFTKGSSVALFGIGRSAGWVAHAMEVYGQPLPDHPNYDYIGVPSAIGDGLPDAAQQRHSEHN